MCRLQKNYEKNLDEDLAKRFENTHRLCDGYLNKFFQMLRKGVYQYEYMDNWQRLNETSLPDKKEFNSNLAIENITDTNYKHANRV